MAPSILNVRSVATQMAAATLRNPKHQRAHWVKEVFEVVVLSPLYTPNWFLKAPYVLSERDIHTQLHIRIYDNLRIHSKIRNWGPLSTTERSVMFNTRFEIPKKAYKEIRIAVGPWRDGHTFVNMYLCVRVSTWKNYTIKQDLSGKASFTRNENLLWVFYEFYKEYKLCSSLAK